MARKIYISSEMSVDEELSDIAEVDPILSLLWPWFLTAFDDWGRADASPKRIKNAVFQANELVTIDIIKKALQAYSGRLITLYESGGKWYMFIDPDKWFKYQTHIRKEKREKDSSKYPAPPDEDNSAQMREIARGFAEVSANLTDCIPSPSPSPSLSPSPSPSKDFSSSGNPFSIFENHGFGKLDDVTRDFIIYAIDDVGETWVVMAMKEAIAQGKKSWSYVDRGVLKRWKTLNVDKPWEIEKKAGEPNGTNGEGVRQGSPSIHDQPIKGPVGVLPSKYAPNVLQMPKVSG